MAETSASFVQMHATATSLQLHTCRSRPRMDTSNFYIPLDIKCSITDELLAFAKGLADEDWDMQRGFLVTMIPDEIIDKDPYLKAVKKKYKVLQVMVCLPPHTCYPWHKDLNRRTIINMPLNAHGKSCCVFTNQLNDEQYFEIAELRYEPATYYIFNTQEDHMVLNFEEKRYLFSFTLTGIRDVPFREVADSLLKIQADLRRPRRKATASRGRPPAKASSSGAHGRRGSTKAVI